MSSSPSDLVLETIIRKLGPKEAQKFRLINSRVNRLVERNSKYVPKLWINCLRLTKQQAEICKPDRIWEQLDNLSTIQWISCKILDLAEVSTETMRQHIMPVSMKMCEFLESIELTKKETTPEDLEMFCRLVAIPRIIFYVAYHTHNLVTANQVLQILSCLDISKEDVDLEDDGGKFTLSLSANTELTKDVATEFLRVSEHFRSRHVLISKATCNVQAKIYEQFAVELFKERESIKINPKGRILTILIYEQLDVSTSYRIMRALYEQYPDGLFQHANNSLLFVLENTNEVMRCHITRLTYPTN